MEGEHVRKVNALKIKCLCHRGVSVGMFENAF